MRYLFLFILLGLVACNGNDENNDDGSNANNSAPPPPSIAYSVVNVHPHDTSSYTQGLIWSNNTLYEGTGLEGQSKLMKVDLNSGKAQQSINMDNVIFGEGITIFNDKIYQLTYRNNKVFVYDLKTFKKTQEFSWPYEGWGLTHNGTDLIVTTGSSNLYFVDPNGFKIKRIVGVSDNSGPVGNLNELEFVNGVIYSNIYETNYIIKIDPETGKVLGRMDLSDIWQRSGKQPDNTILSDPQNVLNGIAYDSAKDILLVTGKRWPSLFEIKLN